MMRLKVLPRPSRAECIPWRAPRAVAPIFVFPEPHSATMRAIFLRASCRLVASATASWASYSEYPAWAMMVSLTASTSSLNGSAAGSNRGWNWLRIRWATVAPKVFR